MSSDEEWIRDRFRTLIAPELFARARPSADPLLISIGGQPGAGKTHGRDRALRLNDDATVTAIIGDDLRAYHPDYHRLIVEDPLAMPAATFPASARWVELALDYAREHRYDVLVEGTFRRPEITLGTAERFHNAGYRTHLVALAVPPWESQLASLERFQIDHATTRTARWTDPAAHDAGVQGTTRTLEAAAASAVVDRISIVTREGRTLFDGSRPAPLDAAATAVRDVHQAPPSPADVLDWEMRRRDVVAYLRRELPHTPETEHAVHALQQHAERLHQLRRDDDGMGTLRAEIEETAARAERSASERLPRRTPTDTSLPPEAPSPQHRGPRL